MSLPPLPRTLILDYYDSYTNNLLTLFTQLYSDAEVLQKVVVVKADTYTWSDFQQTVLPHIDCVILSPGPGRPDNQADIGFALDLLRLHPLPILGVCLGHQAIAVAFGGKIINTPQITHGHVISVAPVQPATGLFVSKLCQNGQSSVQDGQFDVVVYNSLTVDPDSLPDELEVTARSVSEMGRPSTIQGLKHKDYPIWGVQYHPESISSTRGAVLLQAFINEVHIHHFRPATFPRLPSNIIKSCAYRVASGPSSRSRDFLSTVDSLPTPPMTPSRTPSPPLNRASRSRDLQMVERKFGQLGKDRKTEDVFDAVVRRPSRKGKERAIGEVWLDGQTPTRPTISSLASPSFALTYCLSDRTVTLHTPASAPTSLVLENEQSFWDWFSEGQEAISASVPSRDGPSHGWQGGWTGWFAYEMKEESLQGYKRRSEGSESVGHIDACWAWSDLVLERQSDGEWKARAIVRDRIWDEDGDGDDMSTWLSRCGVTVGLSQAEVDEYFTSVQAALAANVASPASSIPADFPTFHPSATGEDYQSRIDGCREAIRQGESYELTLTTRFEADIPPDTDPYNLYIRLRTFNPAYHSAYMYFPSFSTYHGKGLTVLSSSPERFLKIDGSRKVEMMPIKGTRARVKPGQCVCQPGKGCGGRSPGSPECAEEGRKEDARIGEELRTDQKERAENLMIVDLIRSDLLSCCIPSTVTVPKLIALESYGVHNLVTTVQGELAANVGSVEAVKRCFPPGSMTGAPKLRSVQLLDEFEKHQRRGIYSGALGYFSVDGTADLSVVIRTIVKEGENLSIGAGGAITWLSDREMEWEEVLTKVRSVVGTLGGSSA